MLSYLRLSITDQCDMACTYCMPYRKSLSRADSVLSVDEIGIAVGG